MIKRESGNSFNEKITGVIVTCLLLFVALVIIVGSVESIVAEGETLSQDELTNIQGIDGWSDRTSVLNMDFKQTYIEEMAKTWANSNDDALKSVIIKAFIKEKNPVTGQIYIKDIFKWAFEKQISLDSKNSLAPSLNKFVLQLWDGADWKNALELYGNLKPEQRTKLLENLRNGIDGEKREGKLPRDLELLQVVLTGKNIAEGKPLGAENQKALDDFIKAGYDKDLAKSFIKEVVEDKSKEGVAYNNLKKLLESLKKSDTKEKPGEMFKKFWASIKGKDDAETKDLKNKLLDKFWKENSGKDKKYVEDLFNSYDVKIAGEKAEKQIIDDFLKTKINEMHAIKNKDKKGSDFALKNFESGDLKIKFSENGEDLFLTLGDGKKVFSLFALEHHLNGIKRVGESINLEGSREFSSNDNDKFTIELSKDILGKAVDSKPLITFGTQVGANYGNINIEGYYPVNLAYADSEKLEASNFKIEPSSEGGLKITGKGWIRSGDKFSKIGDGVSEWVGAKQISSVGFTVDKLKRGGSDLLVLESNYNPYAQSGDKVSRKSDGNPNHLKEIQRVSIDSTLGDINVANRIIPNPPGTNGLSNGNLVALVQGTISPPAGLKIEQVIPHSTPVDDDGDSAFAFSRPNNLPQVPTSVPTTSTPVTAPGGAPGAVAPPSGSATIPTPSTSSGSTSVPVSTTNIGGSTTDRPIDDLPGAVIGSGVSTPTSSSTGSTPTIQVPTNIAINTQAFTGTILYIDADGVQVTGNQPGTPSSVVVTPTQSGITPVSSSGGLNLGIVVNNNHRDVVVQRINPPVVLGTTGTVPQPGQIGQIGQPVQPVQSGQTGFIGTIPQPGASSVWNYATATDGSVVFYSGARPSYWPVATTNPIGTSTPISGITPSNTLPGTTSGISTPTPTPVTPPATATPTAPGIPGGVVGPPSGATTPTSGSSATPSSTGSSPGTTNLNPPGTTPIGTTTATGLPPAPLPTGFPGSAVVPTQTPTQTPASTQLNQAITQFLNSNTDQKLKDSFKQNPDGSYSLTGPFTTSTNRPPRGGNNFKSNKIVSAGQNAQGNLRIGISPPTGSSIKYFYYCGTQCGGKWIQETMTK